MKVLYDHQIFNEQKFGGISKYFVELIIELQKLNDFGFKLPIIYSSNSYISSIPGIDIKGESDFYNSFMFGKEFKGKWRLYQLLNKYNKKASANIEHSVKMITRGNFDLFHPTDLNPYFLNYIGSKPYIITIHDMIEEIFPEYRFDVYTTYKNSIKKRIVENAAKVISISHQTKSDIIKFYDIEESKIQVVHHGSEAVEKSWKPKSDSLNFPEKFILYVGKRVHYKNFYFLISAMAKIFKQHKDLKMVCCGLPFTQKENTFIEDLGIMKSVLCYQVSEIELSSFYQRAQMLVYPSLYEGFGLPILEAFKNNCPIAISDISVFREVAGDAAEFFNPKDANAVRDSITLLLTNKELCSSLRAKGQKRLQLFSTKKMAEETRIVYNQAVTV